MDSFTTEAFTLLGVGLFVIGLRTYSRISTVGIRALTADDYLMFLAAVAYSAETALAYSVGAYWHGLANNGMTDEEREALDPASTEYYLRVNGSKTQVAGWSTYTFLLWILKAAMCTFYLRLTDGLNFRTRIYVGFGMIVSTWLAVLLSILLGCQPFEKNWQIYPDPGNYCQPAISRIDIFVTVVLNVLTDLYLMSIPIPMLWQASLKPIKKAGLMVLFSGGLFVTMAGILRCVLIITDPVNGAEQAGSWACRETFVAVVTSNLPMIFPLLRRWGNPIFSTVRSLSSHGRPSRYGNGTARTGPEPGAFILEDKNPRRGMGPRTANPITNFTFSESEEHICDDARSQNQPLPQPLCSPKGGGITVRKEVVLQITEEDRKRHSSSGSEADASVAEAADKGNYYLTQQGMPRKSADAGRPGTGGGAGGGAKAKRGSFGFRSSKTPNSRRGGEGAA